MKNSSRESRRKGLRRGLSHTIKKLLGEKGRGTAVEPENRHMQGLARGKNFGERFDESPVAPLYSEEQIQQAMIDLRKMLAEDDTPGRKEALKGEIAKRIESFGGSWYQRIDYPEHNITSTSNHEWAYIDQGSFNTLSNRLTSEEACILRPWPKWFYIKPIMPDLKGKSVLELGSSNGFFSFRFSEMGASKVTGVEIVRRQYETAAWSAEILNRTNVSFLNTDALLDLTIPVHDIVFLSEVHNHFLFPFYGLLRVVNLARERVILDAGVTHTSEQGITLHSGWHPETNQLIYQHFQMTDGLVMDFLNLIGVPSSRVIRYKSPDSGDHILYDIETTGLKEWRKKPGYPAYMERMINLDFTPPDETGR
jgi:SAM-dependent methyltransferase